jgi:hypothetical protein
MFCRLVLYVSLGRIEDVDVRAKQALAIVLSKMGKRRD